MLGFSWMEVALVCWITGFCVYFVSGSCLGRASIGMGGSGASG